ncbi:MAG: hypothetical protein JWR58_4519 [Pseudonocardia sp.]|jgi:hypothetical protein|nr:hypothetical protein [Pseudonocardia sp.]
MTIGRPPRLFGPVPRPRLSGRRVVERRMHCGRWHEAPSLEPDLMTFPVGLQAAQGSFQLEYAR